MNDLTLAVNERVAALERRLGQLHVVLTVVMSGVGLWCSGRKTAKLFAFERLTSKMLQFEIE